MSNEDYVQLVVNDVLLQGLQSEYVDNNAVSKLYVDNKVSDAIRNLVNGADGAMDTLKEISDALTASEGSIATSIVNQIAAETGDRKAADEDLSAEIKTERERIDAANSNISAEKTRAEDAEGALDGRLITAEAQIGADGRAIANINTSLNSHSDLLDGLENSKFNKSGGAISGAVVLDSYLNFGPNWRVKASADGSKIVFEFKRGDVWRTAVPFISKA